MPSELSHLATSLPSLISERCEYPPPGKTTTAALGASCSIRNGVMVGMSCGSLPTACGAPAGHRTIDSDCDIVNGTSMESKTIANKTIFLIGLFQYLCCSPLPQ